MSSSKNNKEDLMDYNDLQQKGQKNARDFHASTQFTKCHAEFHDTGINDGNFTSMTSVTAIVISDKPQLCEKKAYGHEMIYFPLGTAVQQKIF